MPRGIIHIKCFQHDPPDHRRIPYSGRKSIAQWSALDSLADFSTTDAHGWTRIEIFFSLFIRTTICQNLRRPRRFSRRHWSAPVLGLILPHKINS